MLAKVAIVGGAFYFIYQQLLQKNELNWDSLKKIVIQEKPFGVLFLLLFLIFMNRFLEVLKWHNLAKTLRPLPLMESVQQSLGALTAAIFTPNGIGEYAGLLLYYPKEQSKQVLFLNLIRNGIQMIITVLFGIIGLIVFNLHFEVLPHWQVLSILLGGVLLVLIVVSVKKIKIKGYSLQLLLEKIRELPKQVHRKNLLLAIGRYVSFSHQYLLWFVVFGESVPYWIGLAAVSGMYFVSSSLPSFQFLDFAVKGGVSLLFFGLLGVSDWVVLLVSTLMWISNTVFPVLIGTYFVMTFKPRWKF